MTGKSSTSGSSTRKKWEKWSEYFPAEANSSNCLHESKQLLWVAVAVQDRPDPLKVSLDEPDTTNSDPTFIDPQKALPFEMYLIKASILLGCSQNTKLHYICFCF